MTSISSISFRGVGSESAGSIAYRNNKPEPETTETKSVNFRGSGSESTGSIGHKDKPTECPDCGATLSFKGRKDADKKGVSTVGVLAGLVTLTAATIIALGYAHKTGSFAKLGDNWFGKAVKNLEPAGQKCHEWCAVVKKTGLGWWEMLKGTSKKD